jgi:pimeloyl-ACP methyl ester carboxylesterase
VLPRRAFLGAELPGDDESFVDGGVKLAAVSTGGMAASAGLAGGDLVVEIAGLPVRDLCELSAALRKAGESAAAEIAFVRNGERRVAKATVVEQPLEQLEAVTYGELAVDGARLRTIATRVVQPRALIVVLQGIACESVDQALTPDAPLAGLIAGWAEAGFDSLRFEKRGVGDSDGGPCRDADFSTELADARIAVGRAREIARARKVPLAIFGHSVGGIMAALLASDVDARGVIVYGTPVMRWLECLRDSIRRQMALRGASEEELARQLATIDGLAQAGGLNGRSAAYHEQLDRVDLEGAWKKVTQPVLVVRGEHDWVVREDDQARIGALTGKATIVDVPGLDHLFGWHADREGSLRDYGVGTFDPAIVKVTVEWIERTIAKERT